MGNGNKVGRRAEYAAATRQAIFAAARRLFRERGYFATKVDDIADLARVAPVTVYAVTGGKHELLRNLIEIWTAAPFIEATLSRIQESDDPAAILSLVATAVRNMREEFGDVMQVMLVTAPHDPAVAASLAVATARYREAFVPIARRLAELGALRDGLDLERAVDLFWFYFGYWGLFTLHSENGWSYDSAEHWLREAAGQALLREPRPAQYDISLTEN
ncbi:MAG: TetR/AcrR family transcriptional regulator [Dongiaceae bacterium]